MFGKIMYAFLVQVLFTVGLIFLFGLAISFINKRFYANFGSRARAVCYATGIVGTPVHELSHALFCLIFGHKILEIKLFGVGDDGTLGYVRHSYKKNNIYQNIGNFFIGVAPITVISALMFLVAYLLLPEFVAGVSALEFTGSAGSVFVGVWDMICAFFRCAADWRWWVFIFVGILFALHMTLSLADIKGAIAGLSFLLIALLAVDIALGLIKESLLDGFTAVVMSMGGYMLCFFAIALIISLVALLISFIVRAARH